MPRQLAFGFDIILYILGKGLRKSSGWNNLFDFAPLLLLYLFGFKQKDVSSRSSVGFIYLSFNGHRRAAKEIRSTVCAVILRRSSCRKMMQEWQMYSYGLSVLFIYIPRQSQTIRAKCVNCYPGKQRIAAWKKLRLIRWIYRACKCWYPVAVQTVVGELLAESLDNPKQILPWWIFTTHLLSLQLYFIRSNIFKFYSCQIVRKIKCTIGECFIYFFHSTFNFHCQAIVVVRTEETLTPKVTVGVLLRLIDIKL